MSACLGAPSTYNTVQEESYTVEECSSNCVDRRFLTMQQPKVCWFCCRGTHTGCCGSGRIAGRGRGVARRTCRAGRGRGVARRTCRAGSSVLYSKLRGRPSESRAEELAQETLQRGASLL